MSIALFVVVSLFVATSLFVASSLSVAAVNHSSFYRMAGKRARKAQSRVPKENRKNLRLWAEGAREGVLAPHITPYADARARGWTAQRNYLEAVYTQFHTLFSWRLKDHEEPTMPLPPYDPNIILTPEELSPEDLVQKLARIKVLNDVSGAICS